MLDVRSARDECARGVCKRRTGRDDVVDEHDASSAHERRRLAREPADRAQTRPARATALRVAGNLAQREQHGSLGTFA